MIALILSEAGRAAAALAAMAIPSAHAQEATPVVVTEAPEPPQYQVPPEKVRCVRNWRRAYYAAQALDIGTTVVGIESGRGREANPVYKLIFGADVKSWHVLAMKGLTIGANEWHMSRSADFDGACRTYKISAGVIGGVALLNLRVLF